MPKKRQKKTSTTEETANSSSMSLKQSKSRGTPPDAKLDDYIEDDILKKQKNKRNSKHKKSKTDSIKNTKSHQQNPSDLSQVLDKLYGGNGKRNSKSSKLKKHSKRNSKIKTTTKPTHNQQPSDLSQALMKLYGKSETNPYEAVDDIENKKHKKKTDKKKDSYKEERRKGDRRKMSNLSETLMKLYGKSDEIFDEDNSTSNNNNNNNNKTLTKPKSNTFLNVKDSTTNTRTVIRTLSNSNMTYGGKKSWLKDIEMEDEDEFIKKQSIRLESNNSNESNSKKNNLADLMEDLYGDISTQTMKEARKNRRIKKKKNKNGGKRSNSVLGDELAEKYGIMEDSLSESMSIQYPDLNKWLIENGFGYLWNGLKSQDCMTVEDLILLKGKDFDDMIKEITLNVKNGKYYKNGKIIKFNKNEQKKFIILVENLRKKFPIKSDIIPPSYDTDSDVDDNNNIIGNGINDKHVKTLTSFLDDKYKNEVKQDDNIEKNMNDKEKSEYKTLNNTITHIKNMISYIEEHNTDVNKKRNVISQSIKKILQQIEELLLQYSNQCYETYNDNSNKFLKHCKVFLQDLQSTQNNITKVVKKKSKNKKNDSRITNIVADALQNYRNNYDSLKNQYPTNSGEFWDNDLSQSLSRNNTFIDLLQHMNCLRSYYISVMNDINEWIENLKLNDAAQQRISTIFNVKGILLPHSISEYNNMLTEITDLNWSVNKSENIDMNFIETTMMQNGGGFIPDNSLSFLLENLFKKTQQKPYSLNIKIKQNYLNNDLLKNELNKIIGPNNCGEYIMNYFPDSINSSLINILKQKNNNLTTLTPLIIFLNNINSNNNQINNNNNNGKKNVMDTTDEDDDISTPIPTNINGNNNNDNKMNLSNVTNINDDSSESTADFDWDKYENENENENSMDPDEVEKKYQTLVAAKTPKFNKDGGNLNPRRFDSVIIHKGKESVMSMNDSMNESQMNTPTSVLIKDTPTYALNPLISNDSEQELSVIRRSSFDDKYKTMLDGMNKKIDEIWEWVKFQKTIDYDDDNKQNENKENNNTNNNNIKNEHIPTESTVIRQIHGLVNGTLSPLPSGKLKNGNSNNNNSNKKTKGDFHD